MPTPIIMPRQGQSVESCILVEWLVQPGDTVAEGAVLANIETDKAVFELESPATGTFLEAFFTAGDDIPVLTAIGAIGEPGEDLSALQAGGEAPAEEKREAALDLQEPSAAQKQTDPPDRSDRSNPSTAGVSPRARKRAKEAGIDAASLSGTGPGGRIIERDVMAAGMSGVGEPPATDRPAATGDAEVTPVRGIRKIIAQRMLASLQGTAQLTLTRTAEVTSLLAFREKLKANADKWGLPKISINDLVAFLTIWSLRRHPDLNAHFLGDRIEQHKSIHLGMAVDTDRGLMVPVVKDAGAMSLGALAKQILALATACREGSIKPDAMQGATFTITNLGALGVESFTPVLNPPEVAILGIGTTRLIAVRRGGEIAYEDAIDLNLTIDHQAVDGAPGARFLQTLADALADPELLLMT
jgi:pyruvate dehydrogenase E2 component (dihydrolipoamide acetyltransferase)